MRINEGYFLLLLISYIIYVFLLFPNDYRTTIPKETKPQIQRDKILSQYSDQSFIRITEKRITCQFHIFNHYFFSVIFFLVYYSNRSQISCLGLT